MYKVMIVPDIWSDDLFDMLDDCGMWIYVGLWQIAERSAVFQPKFREIRKKLGSRYTVEQIEAAYKTLVEERKVIEYEAEGKHLAWIKAYHEIQKIENPPPPKLPLPPWVRYVNDNLPGENKRSKYRYVVEDWDFSQDPPRPRQQPTAAAMPVLPPEPARPRQQPTRQEFPPPALIPKQLRHIQDARAALQSGGGRKP